MKLSSKKIQKLYDVIIKCMDKIIKTGKDIIKVNNEINVKVAKLDRLLTVLENAKTELEKGD